MSNSKHIIKIHVCRSAFRRRNSLLQEAIEIDKADETEEADEANETDKTDEVDEADKADEQIK